MTTIIRNQQDLDNYIKENGDCNPETNCPSCGGEKHYLDDVCTTCAPQLDCGTCHGLGIVTLWQGRSRTIIPCPDCQ